MVATVKLKVRASNFNLDLPGLVFLQVLEAELSALQKFTFTVEWLLFIAESIWITTGTLRYCDDNENPEDEADTSQWRELDGETVLRAGHYEFQNSVERSIRPFIRIEHKSDTSATNSSQSDRSRSFRRRVAERERQRCAVTGMAIALTASHIVPKRLGDAITRDIYANRSPHDRADRWSPENGVFLCDPADRLFDRFLGSFYPTTTPDTYLFHSFDPNMQTPIFVMTDTWLSVHQRQCHFVSNADVRVPPAGILAWHYAQTAIKVFGTTAFRQATTRYAVLTYREETGSTDESHYTYDINESPIIKIDQAKSREVTRAYEAKKMTIVDEWLSTTLSIQAVKDQQH